MSVKAKSAKEIHCEAHNHWDIRCPLGNGHKRRGIDKCWGCGWAFWAGERYPYGPGSRKPS
ncbi:unnamed protein product [marine sediment metagenome]|uniref:Uncharacterized protein n=1 Tax=marine sediment metagenome TaxID=412755 RepID=X1KBA7_9ZZZZ